MYFKYMNLVRYDGEYRPAPHAVLWEFISDLHFDNQQLKPQSGPITMPVDSVFRARTFTRTGLLECIEDCDDERLLAALQWPCVQADRAVLTHALCFATRKNRVQSVQLLVQEGADPFLKHRGRSPLYWAVRQNNVSQLECLLDKAMSRLQDERLKQQLLSKSYDTSTEEARFLSRANRALNEAAFDACGHCCLQSLQHLLKCGVDVNSYFYHDDEFLSWCTPLIAACYAPVSHTSSSGHEREEVEEVVHCLVSHGADVGMTNHLGDTALHWCAASGLSRSAKTLLHNGAEINKTNSMHKSALMMALEYAGMHTDHNQPLVELLLKWGADVSIVDWDVWNALFYAVQSGCEEVVLTLLKRGAKTDIELCANGRQARTSALLIAIGTSHSLPLVKMLIQWQADVDALYLCDGKESPILMSAMDEDSEDVLHLLIAAGASYKAMQNTLKHLENRPQWSDVPSLQEKLKQAIIQPRSLKQLSRLCLHDVICGRISSRDVPLPESLIRYLMFDCL